MPSHEPIASSAPLMKVDRGVATITLNRPAHRNRLEEDDLRTLLRYFEQIDADPLVRVVKLTANTRGQPKPVFCAGYHIGASAPRTVIPSCSSGWPMRWLRCARSRCAR